MNFESCNHGLLFGAITTQGAIRLSKSVAEFLIEKFGSLDLYADLKFEKKLNLIGIGVSLTSTNAANESLAKMTIITVRKPDADIVTGVFIAASVALKHFHIDFSHGHSHPMEWNEELKLLIMDLNI